MFPLVSMARELNSQEIAFCLYCKSAPAVSATHALQHCVSWTVKLVRSKRETDQCIFIVRGECSTKCKPRALAAERTFGLVQIFSIFIISGVTITQVKQFGFFVVYCVRASADLNWRCSMDFNGAVPLCTS